MPRAGTWPVLSMRRIKSSVPRLIGKELVAADGYSLGEIKEGTLYRMYIPAEQGEVLKFCAFAIMEFGGMFDKVFINDASVGRMRVVNTEDIRKLPVDEKNEHLLRVGDYDFYDMLE